MRPAEAINPSVTTSDSIGTGPTAIRITPQQVTRGVGETRRFRTIDNLGRVPADAEWTIDNETLAGFPSIVPFTRFSVETMRFDPSNTVMAAKTLPLHPLIGWRYWRTIQLAPGKVRVETGAVDKAAPFGALPYFLMPKAQLQMWSQMMDGIREGLGASMDLSVSDAWGWKAGRWNPRDVDKLYIMSHVCGAAVNTNHWVCEPD